MATKISNALKVSLDYLVGKTNLQLDNDVLSRIEEVNKMNEEDKKMIFSFLDAFITKKKIQSII